MNILEENKSCFKDCFYSFSRVDVRSFPYPSHSVLFFGFHPRFSFNLFSVLFSVNFWFHCFPPLSSSLVFSFSISHREDDRFHASGRSGPGVYAPFFLPKRAVSSRGDFTKFLRCRERRQHPARPSREEAQIKGGPLPLPNINM